MQISSLKEMENSDIQQISIEVLKVFCPQKTHVGTPVNN